MNVFFLKFFPPWRASLSLASEFCLFIMSLTITSSVLYLFACLVCSIFSKSISHSCSSNVASSCSSSSSGLWWWYLSSNLSSWRLVPTRAYDSYYPTTTGLSSWNLTFLTIFLISFLSGITISGRKDDSSFIWARNFAFDGVSSISFSSSRLMIEIPTGLVNFCSWLKLDFYADICDIFISSFCFWSYWF